MRTNALAPSACLACSRTRTNGWRRPAPTRSPRTRQPAIPVSFRGNRYSARSGRIGDVQPQCRDDRGDQRETRQRIKSAGKTPGVVFSPANGGGAEEATKIADGVDPRNSGRRGGAGQEQ